MAVTMVNVEKEVELRQLAMVVARNNVGEDVDIAVVLTKENIPQHIYAAYCNDPCSRRW